MTLVLGVDIGNSGAVAVLDTTGALVAIHDMPTLSSGPKNRSSLNAPLLASIIYATHASIAYVEFVSARPGESSVSGFSFGRAKGILEGILAAAGIPVTFLTPPTWKRAIGLPPGRDKDASRSEAIRRSPTNADLFARKKDDGRAEAYLIGIAGLLRKGAIS